jgi:hypothetical protein
MSLTIEQKKNIAVNKIMARKMRLNSYDVTVFTDVPNFIVNAFFEKSNYLKRMIISTFGFLNGIQIDDLLRLMQYPTDDKVLF